MPRFFYQARDAGGQLISGTLPAANERQVTASLVRIGYQPIRIQQAGLLQELLEWIPSKRNRVDRQEVLMLLRQLAALLRSGIPLAASLEGAIQQTQSPLLRQILFNVTQRVKGGASFSEALETYPNIFPEMFTSMVRVGEVAGILDQVLDRISQLGTQELETRSRIQSATVYPLVLILFALVVVSVLLVGVLPKFISVFQASKLALPLPTQLLLGISMVVRKYGWLIAMGLAAAAWWGRGFYASPHGRYWVDRQLLQLPLVGPVMRKVLTAWLARTLGAMLKTGVPLLEAISVTEKTIPNVVFQRVLQKTRLAVAEGKSLAESWAASGLFPPLVLQMVTVGERTSQLDTMLIEVAAFFDPEIELTVRNLTTLLEPILLATMGLVVGFIALSVLLPIFQLIHVFKR